ncbi:MAG TPA: phosphate ABC transporter permease subunit PstC [Mycobacteriales bacterium]|jgi:phosphate transport system permease protein|nr:phosphate ABC transporter permease subunit PstC [Mycobacteriales bacterium]
MSTVETTLDTTSLRAGRSGRRGDVVFRGLSLGAGVFVFVLLGAIAVFLVIKAIPALNADKSSFWTTQNWTASSGDAMFGIAAILFGTVLTSLLALVMAVPVGLGVSLYITEYAPQRISRLLGYLTDMLAAVPSVVYGLWALLFLLHHMAGISEFLVRYFGWIPLFSNPDGFPLVYSKSIFAASVILAVMTLPIIAAISREVLRQVDPAQKEAALALGATRWEMVRTAVLPPSRPGIISAVMLGLGRALGETIAVAFVIGNRTLISSHILLPGGATIASNIANLFGEADEIGRSALIASGLVLFLLTLAVNLIARYIILRSGTEERSAV